MNDVTRPSKDLSKIRREWNADYAEGKVIHELAGEIERLQRQVDELSVHASKWVTRALQLQGATGEPRALTDQEWHAVYVASETPTVDVTARKLLRELLGRRHTQPPKSDQCDVCTKPLPPVGAWSMPSCPECQELLEGLGELMADLAEREQTIKADWIGRAINLICARPSQPPRARDADLYEWVSGLIETLNLAGITRAKGDEHIDSDYLAELHSRLAQPPDPEWQPIESAPKDGTAFIAVSGNWIVCMCWNKHRRDWCTVDKHYCSLPEDETFTHWMPLPSPPTKEVR